MALNPRIWHPIAVIGCLANVAGFAFAVSPGETLHAMVHAGLAVAFGVWAQSLKAIRRRRVVDGDTETEVAELGNEVGVLRREVGELQERLDFVERMLTQAREMDQLPRREPGETE